MQTDRPGGTGPDQLLNVVAYIYIYLNFKKHCKLFKIKSVYKNKATSSNRKIATSS